MGAYKTSKLYPFLEELKSGHKRIKEEIAKIEETIINNTGEVKLIEYPNKTSMLYKNKS